MTKQPSKATMDRSRIKNRYLKWPSRENFLELKKAKHFCKNLTKKAKRQYFKSVSSKGRAANKQFWDVVKPFFSNKNLHSDYHISIKDKDKIVDNKLKLVHLFNSYFINAGENTTEKTPTSLGDSSNQKNNTNTVKKITSEYKNHPSVVKIKETYKHFGNFDLPKASPKHINKIIRSLNSKKQQALIRFHLN